jgi:hypothetical protein
MELLSDLKDIDGELPIITDFGGDPSSLNLDWSNTELSEFRGGLSNYLGTPNTMGEVTSDTLDKVASNILGKVTSDTLGEFAPNIPIYWGDLARTHFFTDERLLPTIRKLTRTFYRNSVDFGPSKEHQCGYACTAVYKGATIEFEVCIFSQNGRHIVEIRHMMGCRFSFSHFAEVLAMDLGVVFSGGGRPLPFGPPPLPADFPVVEQPESAERDACHFVSELISNGSPSYMIIQGLRSAGSMTLDKSRIKLFMADGHGLPIMENIIELFKKMDGDFEIQIIAMWALANVAEVSNASIILLDKLAEPFIVDAITSTNAHVRREALRATAALSKYDNLAKKLVKANILNIIDKDTGASDMAAGQFASATLVACRSSVSEMASA